MVFTYIHLLGVFITVVYFATLFYARRNRQFAFYDTSYKEINPNNFGFWNNMMLFGDVVMVAYLTNTSGLSAFEPYIFLGAIGIAIVYEMLGYKTDKQLSSNEAEALVPASYISAKRKMSIIKNVIALVWFAYLIFAF